MISTLLVIAAALFVLEVVLPGGILGLAGSFALLLASIVGFIDHGFLTGASILVLGGAFIVIFFYFEIRFLGSNNAFSRLLSHQKVSTGHTGMEIADDLLGSEGIALTQMSPIGKVRFGDRVVTAYSLDGQISQGEAVIVQNANPFKIEVSRKR
ncbi:MAG: NfeD family protein [Puniceicoccaceae bacterium]